MIPAVRKNQIAEKTGAVVRNFFMEDGENCGAVADNAAVMPERLRWALSAARP
jgi:hypothetical protein